MNCYSVVYQLKKDRETYKFSYRDEWVKAENEEEVKKCLQNEFGAELVEIKSIKLRGSWDSFVKEMERNAD